MSRSDDRSPELGAEAVQNRQILHARAAALARPAAAIAAPDSQLEVLEFRLAQEHYALETAHASEVHVLKELTPLPCTPAFVLGIVNLRGRIVPVLDLRKIFELPEQGLHDLHHIILVRDHECEFGLLADAIIGVRVLPLTALQPSLPTLNGCRADYLRGVTVERLMVLDAERILHDPKIIVNDEDRQAQ